jgi:CRISPR-associated endonuclease/helicase Cas3
VTALTADRFAEFYKAVYGKSDDPDFGPFPWQERLARRVCAGDWPRVIALPTAAGKTACIDIAVFALACGAKEAPRRVFFVVDRRVVVDQAQVHAENLAEVLREPKDGILKTVAESLRDLAHPGWRDLPEKERRHVRPLDVYALRGGMYRETAWARSPLQPTVVASTVDQVGSRLLFRGYGVSDSMKPIHAGLVGNDALILLDEAHCSRPFDQTMQAIEGYRTWGAEERRPPFRFVSMTATPDENAEHAEEQRRATRPADPPLIERDQEEDRKHKILGPRIDASKPTKLTVAEKAKGKKWNQWGPPLVAKLAQEARGLMGTDLGKDQNGKQHTVRAVGIIVNRVATARALREALLEAVDEKTAADQRPDVLLLTGRMRPVDRDELLDQLRPLFSGAKVELAKPVFVVATQCLEVGADLDFHALVTECASLDALRQRFGRLNRVAARPTAKAVLVIRADQTDDSSEDSVYEASLAETWKWLKANSAGDEFNFGVAAVRAATEEADLAPLNAPALDAPVLFPAHLDCWVQTAPMPAPDPDPGVFLRGPESGVPDVQVVFRADLGDNPEVWSDIVALCPPSSSETVPVRINVFREWLAGEGSDDESSDVEGEPGNDADDLEPGARTVLRWKGIRAKETGVVRDPRAVRPGDTFVLPNCAPGVEFLGDFPTLPPSDRGDEAFQRSRDKAILRLRDLDLSADDEEFEEKLSAAVLARLLDTAGEWLERAVKHLSYPRDRIVEPHPSGGWVATGRKRLHQFDPAFLEDDESVESPNRRTVTLVDHSRGVTGYARRFARGCGLPIDTYTLAGLYHDLGKLDPRFQAMLQGRSPRTTAPPPLAKSGASAGSRREREEARAVHRYPKGARHELLSAALVATKTDEDLLLHLIATHHGTARPFADRVDENELARRPFTAESFALDSSAQTTAAWNAVLPERFWRVVRKYGWWGAAYREAVFRLADHAESRAEQEDDWKPDSEDIAAPPLLPTASVAPLQSIELTGLDGSNPLAFLAALGTLRLADHALEGRAKLHWRREGRWVPVLHLPPVSDLVECLHRLVHRVGDPDAGRRAEESEKEYRNRRKAVEKALKGIKDRKLRGAEREAVIVAEVAPLQRDADGARTSWLNALAAAVPAPFLSLGKALSVTDREFRTFAGQMVKRLMAEGPSFRPEGDFAAAFGCEACLLDSGRIAPTEFQLITGSGHQFFLETLATLMESVSPNQIHRALFGPWKYEDPRLSFRWDPIDDRRYAYGWGDPSDEHVRTEHGANLLGAFALPLFPVMPTARRPVTTGFNPRSRPPALTWPVWVHALSVDAVRSLVASAELQEPAPDRAELSARGVADVFRVSRIEVGRPPLSKLNLTAAVTV